MKLNKTLARGSLAPVRATFLSLDGACSGAAQPLPAGQAERGGRGALAALYRRLMKLWVGLYAPPPRRLGPLL